jgi:hypothetical protein
LNAHCALVLAIEFPVSATGNVARPHHYFERSLAQPLANQLAFELGKHLPSLDGLGLVWMAACYDQAQILRPEFPVHAALVGLYQAGVRDAIGQVMTLQALRGEPPVPALAVDEQLLGGPMVLVPFALVGASDAIASARALLEEKLLDAGLADARTALMLNQALGANAEHARLMTLDDLTALCCSQLQHAGLDEVFQVLELALFQPQRTLCTPLGRHELSFAEQRAQLALATLPFNTQPAGALALDAVRVRQTQALLEAHGVALSMTLRAQGALEVNEHFWIDWALDANVHSLCVYRHAQAGAVVYALLDRDQQLLGYLYPRTSQAHTAVRTRFAGLPLETKDVL